MKFYKAKNSSVGEGVYATVLYHKENGDELICVKSGFDLFEEQNEKAKECSTDDADKLIAKAELTISVPVKAKLRKNKLSDDEILQEIEDETTLTVDIAKSEHKDTDGNTLQKLTYFEDMEIKSVEDFLKAQAAQAAEPEQVIVPDQEPEPIDIKELDTSSSNNN